jgi:hypothetical protein
MINKPGHAQNDSQNKTISEGNGTGNIDAGLQHLAAAALAEGWMGKVRARNGERCVSANELTSLSALIVYVSHIAGTSEFRIERDLADRFQVANVKCLPATRYDEAIRYLVDLVPAVSAV